MSEAVSSVRKGKNLPDSSAWRDTVDEDYKKDKQTNTIKATRFCGWL